MHLQLIPADYSMTALQARHAVASSEGSHTCSYLHSPRRNDSAVSANRGAAFPNTGPCPPFGTTHRCDLGIAVHNSNASDTGYSGSRSPNTISVSAVMVPRSGGVKFTSSYA